jgi:pilus assembly protein Flp/PilA
MRLLNSLRALVRNESGQDLLEYALLVALIALVAVVTITASGARVSAIFGDISSVLVTP